MKKKVWYRSKVLWFNAIVALLAAAEMSLRVVQDYLPGNIFAWLTFVLTVGNAALRVLTRQGLKLSDEEAHDVGDGINGG